MYFSYKIKKGDTLQRLSVQYNLYSWKSLAYINDLRYPYIIDSVVDILDKQAHIAYLGDTILIPASNIESLNYVSQKELAKILYGADLKLNFETQLNNIARIDVQGEFSNDELGDLEQVNGYDNIRQSLLIRLTTRYGELPMHKDFGSNFLDMLGMKNTKSNLVKLRLEIMETFKKDYRVYTVKKCVVTDVGQGVLIYCIIYLNNNKEPFVLNELVS